MVNFLIGVIATLFVRELIDWLPALGRLMIRRAAKRLSEDQRDATRDAWLEFATKLPGGNLTKVLWGAACLFMAAQLQKGTRRIFRLILWYIYIRLIVYDFIRLRFASPRALIVRWRLFSSLMEQAMPNRDPGAPQPLLVLAEKAKDEKAKQMLLAMADGLAQLTVARSQQSSRPVEESPPPITLPPQEGISTRQLAEGRDDAAALGSPAGAPEAKGPPT
jgi:hypothetical protein